MLTINNSSTSFQDATSCDSYIWNAQTYLQSGYYAILTQTLNGCDSIANLSLTINYSNESFDTINACDSYQWNGETYIESGVYTYSTHNAGGCDSTTTLILTINNSSTSSQYVTACDSFEWNGDIYYESGVYNYITLNAGGCDSSATLNLTINNSSTSSQEATSCDSYVWNGETYSESGVYTYSTINADGCDSTATLILTINNSSTSSQYVTACDSFEWNGDIYYESGVYTYSTLNTDGCDSILMLNLTINKSDTSIINISTCDYYTWNGNTYTESGIYSYYTQNINGCDSILILNLTIYYNDIQNNYSVNSFINCHSNSVSINLLDTTYQVIWNDETNELVRENLDEGVYYFTIYDSISCLIEDSISIETTPLQISFYYHPPSCFNGNDGYIEANVIGGSGNYTYLWSDGSSSSVINSISNGYYSVIVSDDSGCITFDGHYASNNITPIEINSQITNVTCNGGNDGKIYGNASGGSPFPFVIPFLKYNYEWSHNGYTLFSYPDYSNGGYTIDGLFSSSIPYILEVSDYNGCILIDSFYVNEPDLIQLESYEIEGNYCNTVNNGSISISVNGGILDSMQDYNYSWSNYSTSPNVDSLFSGDYFVSVSDENNCSAIFDFNVPLEESTNISIYSNINSCFVDTQGTVTLKISGGYSPYNVTSFTNNGTQSTIIDSLLQIDSLHPGIISVVSVDSLGCYTSKQSFVDGICADSLTACEIIPDGLFVDNIIHDRVAFNWSAPHSLPSYYMIRYRPVGTSTWTVVSAGPQNNVPFAGSSRTRYFMEPGTTYQWNIRARVVDENGFTLCQSPWSASHQYTTLPACANLTDLSVNTEANLVYFNASKPSGEWDIWQAKGKIREVGTNNYRYLATTLDSYTNQIKYNFTPSTDYEWHTKAWCLGNVDEEGNSDSQYHSGWGEFSAFTTQDPCDKLPINLNTQVIVQSISNILTMSWDTPLSGQPHHYFLELNNETSGQTWQWNNIPGSSNIKTKYNITEGTYSWRIRAACGENGTSWATPFTSYEHYTLGGDRFGNDSHSNSQLTNIRVYPNPSRGEFKISFELNSRQDVYLSITNCLGETIFTEELEDQKSQYYKTIDLANEANGIYMLNITTNNKNIYKKIIIQ